MAQIDYLTLEDLIEIGQATVTDFRIRDLGLLESAVQRPKLTVHGRDAYPDFLHKASSLLHALALNHALIDGNKRFAWVALKVFCIMNRKVINLRIDKAERLINQISLGNLDVTDIARILKPYLKNSKS